MEKGQHDNRHHIIKWYTSYDHKWRHPCISINILDKCNPKKCCAAPVRSLNKFTLDGTVFPDARYQRSNCNADKCYYKAENHKPDIPHFFKINFCQITKQQYRQWNQKDKFIHLCCKLFIHPAKLFEQHSQYHHQKDWYGCIQTKN